MTFIFVSNMDI